MVLSHKTLLTELAAVLIIGSVRTKKFEFICNLEV